MKIEEAQRLIRALSETRSVEVKRWFKPNEPEGKAKLVKGLLALRNFNGGAFVVGFDDGTMQPDLAHVPPDLHSIFHSDTVQETVSHYSSEPFDVETLFPEMDGQKYPVIVVPSGVRTPVAAKRDLMNGLNRALITCNDLYFRTLGANNRVSSAKIPYKDWPELMRICFDNQEADIGSFVRRHLSDLTPDLLHNLTGIFSASLQLSPNSNMLLKQLLSDGEARYLARVLDRSLQLPKHGSMEVGMIIIGTVPTHAVDRQFLQLLDVNNPRLTGWPVWLDSTRFSDEASRPYVMDGGWEALIFSEGDGWLSGHIDFMRKEPIGRFYLRRALQDDVYGGSPAPPPNTTLEFAVTILRIAESIAVGKSFAKAMGCDLETTKLEFAFRWRGLRDRTLSSWANPARYLSESRRATQNEVLSRTTVPLISAPDTIFEYTYEVVARLFELFDGFVISKEIVEDLVRRLLERRL